MIHVVAGALVAADGRVLIADRPAGKSFAGRWEFPGGKLKPGEHPSAALKRELGEELGVEVTSAAPLLAVAYRYPHAEVPVLIDCWRVGSWRGEPTGLDGQRLRWCTREELAEADILEADRAIVVALRLPQLFVHCTERARLQAHAAHAGRRTAWLVDALLVDPALQSRLEAQGDALFVIDPHAPPAAGLGSVHTRPHRFEHDARNRALGGRTVSSVQEAVAAAALGADFLLVPDRMLPAETLAGIAGAGLPWYLNVACPGPANAPAATGTLWWRTAR
jgi:mutator protein MutT